MIKLSLDEFRVLLMLDPGIYTKHTFYCYAEGDIKSSNLIEEAEFRKLIYQADIEGSFSTEECSCLVINGEFAEHVCNYKHGCSTPVEVVWVPNGGINVDDNNKRRI